MTSTLYSSIGELWSFDPEHGAVDSAKLATSADAGVIADAALVVEDGVIAWTGPASAAPDADTRVDLAGAAVVPGWVDSHSHMVFDGDRSAEFEARMAGQAYAAGGIAVTTEATRSASEAKLDALVADRVAQAAALGTTTLETKTGYGLDVDSEALAARVAARHVEEVTFLGAHLVPPEYEHDRAAYVDLVCGPMLDAVADHVGWIDVFCEQGAFTVEESMRVLQAGQARGLGLRVHGNQIGHTGGAAMAVELGAASVDHLNFLSSEDIEMLAASDTVATILPACDLSTRAPLAPARELLDAGATVAIASNLNPGTSYTSSVPFCITTAVLQQQMTLAEAIRAATLGGAAALRRTDVGHLSRSAPANFAVLDAPAAIHMAYRPGMVGVRATVKNGRIIAGALD
ncbi:imidazolonepropionase [Pseudoglutamicibacter albus]|uniref:Imidazolonepropionase n=1 Tax=Pseudoglutamicibacter albus TaxID=98671 RepID=A0ABU1YZI0_9MICC|nr:imidazolonepropionase [Pseudoglutamicibacter albus]MDR7293161.1 imidazolonepropionase [Pseudoglutamicibacter albus]